MDNSRKGIDNRIGWVDLTKCLACLIVLTGHLLQGLVRAGIMQDSFGYGYANKMMYHVNIALFLICSGYLYQKYSYIDSIKDYLKNLRAKAFRLLLPYVFFVTLSWGIKYFLRDEVNTQVDSLFHELVVKPMSPYWFLPALFAMFLIVPPIKGKGALILVNIEAFLIYILIVNSSNVPYIVTLISVIMWFVLGMDLAYSQLDERVFSNNNRILKMAISVTLITAFLLIGFMEYRDNLESELLYLTISLLGCIGIIGLDITICTRFDSGVLTRAADYAMPVYLMHTIFAAGVRILLFNHGVTMLSVHLIIGLIIGIAGPVISYEIWKVINRYVRERR